MKTKMKTILLSFTIVTIATISSCKKDDDHANDDHEHNEEELITSLSLTFTDTAGIKPTLTYAFKDPDGVAGNAPTQFDTLKLSANTVYNVTVSFLDESKNPAVNITSEVEEEDHEHLICFDNTGLNATVVRTDSDGTYEVGLKSRWTLGNASQGNMKVSLKHQPGVKNGNCGVGETDVEVNFPALIQ